MMVQVKREKIKIDKKDVKEVYITIPIFVDPGDTVSITDLLKEGHWEIIFSDEFYERNYKTIKEVVELDMRMRNKIRKEESLLRRWFTKDQEKE